MERNPQSDKYLRAKIEEDNHRLPENLLKPGSDPTEHLQYLKIYEDEYHKAVHLAKEFAAGSPEVDRKVYRIRNKEVSKLITKENDDELLKHIHIVSKATIGLLADSESNIHHQSYLDLLGSFEQVRTAEELILDAILKTYAIYPIILMPPTLYQDKMIIPLHKVGRILGADENDILELEIESGTWIKIDPVQPVSGGSQGETVVLNVFGPESNVITAISLFVSILCEDEQDSEEECLGEEADHKVESVKGKSIHEDTDHQFRVPKSVPKVNSSNDDRVYIKLFGKQPKTAQSSGTDSSAAEKVERKLFRIRNRDLDRLLGNDDRRMKRIHAKSRATIAILCDTQIKIHSQSYLEVLGTLNQVKTAESLIVDAIKQTHDSQFNVTALMPADVINYRIIIPIYKAVRLLGMDGGNKVEKMEAKSGAWIELNIGNPIPGGKTWEKVVMIYGGMKNVTKAMTMIQEALYEGEEECVKSSNEEEEEEYDPENVKWQHDDNDDDDDDDNNNNEAKKNGESRQQCEGEAEAKKNAKTEDDIRLPLRIRLKKLNEQKNTWVLE